jgi:hypothetical protein
MTEAEKIAAAIERHEAGVAAAGSDLAYVIAQAALTVERIVDDDTGETFDTEVSADELSLLGGIIVDAYPVALIEGRYVCPVMKLVGSTIGMGDFVLAAKLGAAVVRDPDGGDLDGRRHQCSIRRACCTAVDGGHLDGSPVGR